MKKINLIIISFCFCLALCSISVSYAEENTLYLNEMGHIPLMSGSAIIDNSSVVFDKPSGRVAEVQLITKKSHEAVSQYYNETLPPLGWKHISDTIFERENDRLTINIEEKDGNSIIFLHIFPIQEKP